MTITLGQYDPKNVLGTAAWTSFTTNAPSNGGAIYYVDSSVVGPGSGSSADPFKAIADAMAIVNVAGAGTDNWVLLRKGKVWSNESFGGVKRSGIAGSPIVFSSYDPAYPVATYGPNPVESTLARPICAITPGFPGAAAVFKDNGGDYLAIIGIELYCSSRDPNNSTITPTYNAPDVNVGCTGISMFAVGQNFLLVEDCKIHFFSQGMNVDTNGPSMKGFNVHRNIISDNILTLGFGDSAGMAFFATSDITIEETLFDHNGWNETIPIAAANHNHNIYIQVNSGPTINRGNIYYELSGPNTRGPAQFYNNLEIGGGWQLEVENGLTVGYTSNYYDNVLIEYGKTGSVAGQAPIKLVSNYDGPNILGSANVYNNISCHSAAPGSQACNIWGMCNNNNVVVTNNIFYDTSGMAGVKFNPAGTPLDFNTNDTGGILTATILTPGTLGTPGTYTNKNITGGSGSGPAQATFVVGGGGGVTSVTISAPLFGAGGGNTDPTWGGYKYVANESIGVLATDIGNVVGFTMQVNTVTGGNSESGNVQDGAGYPDSGRTVASYAVLHGYGSTSNDFVAYVKANQSKSNWSYYLTADAVNTYIRAGFGIGGGTPTPTPPPIQISHGKHVGKPTKIPHI